MSIRSIIVDQIVVSDKFNHNNEGFKYFIGYQEGAIVKPLCIILPHMSGYIKYLNMSFLIKVWQKYEQIWDVIKNKRGIKFHSEPIYKQKYLKAKVREFDGVVKTNFLRNDMPKENMHYACIACMTIDSAMRIDKKDHPQVYLEHCKYRVKKRQMSRFINTELKSDTDWELDSEEESKFDAELMAKLESGTDSE